MYIYWSELLILSLVYFFNFLKVSSAFIATSGYFNLDIACLLLLFFFLQIFCTPGQLPSLYPLFLQLFESFLKETHFSCIEIHTETISGESSSRDFWPLGSSQSRSDVYGQLQSQWDFHWHSPRRLQELACG